jgi:preprotein translocase subunit SecA
MGDLRGGGFGGPAVLQGVQGALRARECYRRGVDYIVSGGQVRPLVSGRLPTGVDFSSGLRQAIEAKEKVAVTPVPWAGAIITGVEYFQLYANLAGTSFARVAPDGELAQVYGLGVVDLHSRSEGPGAAELEDAAAQRVEKMKQWLQWQAMGQAQREDLYAARQRLLESADPHADVLVWLDAVVRGIFLDAERGGVHDLHGELAKLYPVSIAPAQLSGPTTQVLALVLADARLAYEGVMGRVATLVPPDVERVASLKSIDAAWAVHLKNTEALLASHFPDDLSGCEQALSQEYRAMLDRIMYGTVYSLFAIESIIPKR